MPLATLNVASPRQSPVVPLGHVSPGMRQLRGDSTPQYWANDSSSSYFKGSYIQEHPYDTDGGGSASNNNKSRNVRRSGPLDYSSGRKAEHTEGSSSTGISPLPRFAVSRSGPLMHK
ncbi:unnamed protein product [Linum tenue]|uniref:Uncharacterized protein n=1 Tax=Linum tenue TaxID=586396 RepID=A0AAV0I8L8_9ROSI|nr:unnamed protein product [Linum tenue]